MKSHAKDITVSLLFFLTVILFATMCTAKRSTEKPDLNYPFSNPIVYRADDPWVIYDDRSGYDCYYYVWSGGDGVRLAKMDDFYKLQEVYNIPGKFIQAWTSTYRTPYSSEIWAPELHFLNGKWYIYVAASSGQQDHRMYAIESKTGDPMDGFDFIGEMEATPDRWAIDGTVMRYNGKLYFVWSGWEGSENVAQHLYIAEMESPVKLSSERVKISSPELPWETIGNPLINEGPVAVEHNGLTHMMYSASGSWTDDYCVGLLTLTGNDPLDPASWTKKSEPLLSKMDGMYGPGHPSVTKSRDGREWIIYHANPAANLGWRGRAGWAQLIIWDDNNNPIVHIDNGEPDE